MQRVRAHGLTVSLDGFLAGPKQSLEQPLGIGGTRLHEWAWATRSMRKLHGLDGGEAGVDEAWALRHDEGIGATIMGRNMFGPVRGAWRGSEWTGWWGEDPPFHHPVFVLTHHQRPPLHMAGGTTFYFVTNGIRAALAEAREAAGDLDVRVGGGAHTLQQFLRVGLIDELHVAISPTFLGDGERLFDKLPDVADGYECAEKAAGERAFHVLLRRRTAALEPPAETLAGAS